MSKNANVYVTFEVPTLQFTLQRLKLFQEK